jgi:hypothetical protein
VLQAPPIGTGGNIASLREHEDSIKLAPQSPFARLAIP